jgi:hypothetical protein
MEKIPNNFSASFLIKLNPKKSLVAVLVASLLAFLTTKCGISKQDFLKYYNEFRKLIKWDLPDSIIDEIDDQFNRQINEDPELLRQKIQSGVDVAIARYEIEEYKNRKINMKNKNILEEINKPKYDALQKKILEDAVYYEFSDGTMGIRGAWVKPDSREIPLE